MSNAHLHEELVRFSFRGKLIRITSEGGFEISGDGGEWTIVDDVRGMLDEDDKAGVALGELLDVASNLDGLEKKLGTEVFYAAIRTDGFRKLGFSDAVLN